MGNRIPKTIGSPLESVRATIDRRKTALYEGADITAASPGNQLPS